MVSMSDDLQQQYDVVVIGGGAAGLNGALMLARSRRSVVVLDVGQPRNAPAEGVHGLLGREGMPPSELLELPGVGPYAAGATAAVAFSARTHVVDGVTARVYRRYFGLDGDGPASSDRALWDVVEEATPLRAIKEWNWAVLDLAATVCLPQVPRCSSCPLRLTCAHAASAFAASDPPARIRA